MFYKKWEGCGGVSDCEELSGGYSQEMMDWDYYLTIVVLICTI